MYWFIMREEFKCVYEKAEKLLKNIRYEKGKMVSTSKIIDEVEKATNTDIKFTEFDFSEIKDYDGKVGTFKDCGAAMYVSPASEKERGKARILLNDRENPKMQRFSLIHELGHLMLEGQNCVNGYLFSTHINMNLTSIPKKQYERDEFLKKEQMANIFALLVLMPEDSFEYALEEYDSLDDIGHLFGVTKDAVISRLMLGIGVEV